MDSPFRYDCMGVKFYSSVHWSKTNINGDDSVKVSDVNKELLNQG